MNWTLYTTATAAETDYDAALARIFGSAACDARGNRERNGSHPNHPLHPLYAAKNAAENAWNAENGRPNSAFAETKNATETAA